MNSTEWATRLDRSEERFQQEWAELWLEEGWAMSLGFKTADEYHVAVSETFAEELHQDRLFAGNAE